MPTPDAIIGTILKIGDSVFEFVDGECSECAFSCHGNCKPHSEYPVLGEAFDAIVPENCEGVREPDQPSFILRHISGPIETPFTSIPKCPVCETHEFMAPTGFELDRDNATLGVEYRCSSCGNAYTISTTVSKETYEAGHNKSAEPDKSGTTTYSQYIEGLERCPVCKGEPTVLSIFIPTVESDSFGVTEIVVQCRDCKITVGPHTDFSVARDIWNRVSNSRK